MNEIDRKALRSAFGSYLTGVTVVTACDPSGQPVGFTANSFTSVSLDPPLLLVCPSRALSSFPVFESCRYFAINVLAEGQESVSNTFAGFKGDRFGQVGWDVDLHGCPRLDGAAASFACRTQRVEPAGDHVILIGQVVDFTGSTRRGLGFAAGQYFSLGLERQADSAPTRDGAAHAGAIIEHDGRILLREHDHGLCPPMTELTSPVGVRAAMSRWLRDAGLDVTLGNTYSIFEDGERGGHFTWFRADAAGSDGHGLGRYYPIEDLPGLHFTTPVLASMLGRYALEHRTQSFGLYLGDEREGDLLGYHARI